jgi:CheY-like chemotaxis protein
MRVLLIEDNISTQYLFAQVLKGLGHEVEAFTDAE